MASEKIKALRSWMKKNNVDAYIVPHADRFQSEYLSERDERLAWLTGFTGSAGMAVVMTKKAALFTDGRYTLQAPKQVDTKIFEIIEMPPNRVAQFFVDHLKDGSRIGYDPYLFTVNQFEAYKKAADECGFQMTAIDENPVDILWKDRPAEKIAPAEIHPAKFSGVSTTDKIKHVLNKLNQEAESLLIAVPGLVCWLLNLRGRDVAHNPILQSLALLDRSGHVTLFTDKRKIDERVRRALDNHVDIQELDSLFKVLAGQKKPVQLDPRECPVAIRDFLVAKKIRIIPAEDPNLLLRAMKNKTELKGAETAQEKDKKSFDKFLKWFHGCNFIKNKITELDIVAKLRECRAQDPDFIDESFDTIAGYGPNGAIVHYRADEKSNLRLKPGSLLLLDSGAQYRCGTTDITRTLAVGKPTTTMRKHYTAVLKGLIALSSARFPKGTTGGQLDALARAHVWQIGADYNHGTGHGVGSFMSVHEGPQGFSFNAHAPLQPGMILSVEPGIYITGSHGIRLENLVVVIEDKHKNDSREMLALKTLTKVPFDSSLIDWNAMTPMEEAFLKDFGTVRPKK